MRRGVDPPSPLKPYAEAQALAQASLASLLSGESRREPDRAPARRHTFRTAPGGPISHSLVEGYLPSPSTRRIAELKRSSASALSLSAERALFSPTARPSRGVGRAGKG